MSAITMDQMLDRHLVALAQSGDQRAFDTLMNRYRDKVLSLVLRYVQDQCDAEDVTQEVFIRAYRGLEGFQGKCAFYTWVYRIAVNASKNFLVARKCIAQPTDSLTLERASTCAEYGTPEAWTEGRELGERIEVVLSGLPEELRTAITLREFRCLSYNEIAAFMNCPVGTVRSRIFRAREIVSERITKGWRV